MNLRGMYPFFSHKKINLPTSPHPNLQRKKQRQEKKNGTNPPRGQHPQAPTSDEWHAKAMHSGLIAASGSCSTALALLPEVWQATNIHLPNSAPKNGERFPAFPQDQKKGDMCPRMKNWTVKTHVDLKHLKDAPFQNQPILRKETYKNHIFQFKLRWGHQ